VELLRNFKILRDSNNQIRYANFRDALTLSEGTMPDSRVSYDVLRGKHLAVNFEIPLWTPVWTRSIVAYPDPDAPFGKYVEYEDVRGLRSVVATGDFRGERGMAIVIDSYALREDSGRIVVEQEGPLKALAEFPQKDQHSRLFGSDPETALPVLSGSGKIALWRNMRASIVPAVWALHGSNTSAAWLRYGMSEEFGVLASPLSSS
jgi:hypothetical protein